MKVKELINLLSDSKVVHPNSDLVIIDNKSADKDGSFKFFDIDGVKVLKLWSANPYTIITLFSDKLASHIKRQE